MSSIKYIYVYIEYIKSKSNNQNCKVKNNMKMIFATENFKSLVPMFSMFHDQASALEAFLSKKWVK